MSWKLATFNVNGIRARLPIVRSWIEKHRPDVLCLQEIKCSDHEFPVETFREAGYESTVKGRKSHSGVAILSRGRPSETMTHFQEEARLLAASFHGIWVVNTYAPQGRDPQDPAFQAKLDFFKELKAWFAAHFRPDQPLVWLGDINVAPEPIDVYDPKRLDGKIGFHPQERKALADVVAWGFQDVFRIHHPTEKQFTFWDYRIPSSHAKNLGWRLDHIWATRPLAENSIDCRVDEEPRTMDRPSDHAPVWAEFRVKNQES
ncbi:MAG: exodeoxyribonuclease III [Syntrophobacteraceae bacterium]|nr:exodeoxyribonuclease III [Syntrophobacteraceae bacterium]